MTDADRLAPASEISAEMGDSGGRLIDHYDRDFDDPAELARDVLETMIALKEHGFPPAA